MRVWPKPAAAAPADPDRSLKEPHLVERLTQRRLSLDNLAVEIHRAPTWYEDAKHNFMQSVYMLPVFVCLGVVTFALLAAFDFLAASLPADRVLIWCFLVLFGVNSAGYVTLFDRVFHLPILQTVLSCIALVLPTAAVFAALYFQPETWDEKQIVSLFCIASGLGIGLHCIPLFSSSAALAIFKALYAVSIGGCSILAMFFVVMYSRVLLSNEILIVDIAFSGVLYPMYMALIGKAALVDFLTFGVLAIHPDLSFKDLAEHFGLFAKQLNQGVGQIIMCLLPLSAFLPAVILSNLAEVASLWFNVHLMRFKTIRKAQVSPKSPPEARVAGLLSYFRGWVQLRGVQLNEKILLNFVVEEQGEKANAAAAIFVAAFWAGEQTPGMLGVRFSVFLLAELVEDVLKRRLLFYMSGISTTHVKQAWPAPNLVLRCTLNACAALCAVLTGRALVSLPT